MRIVSLLSSATEILFAIGAGDDVVAISHECDYPPAATKLPRATRSRIDSSRPSDQIDQQVKRLLESGEQLYALDQKLIRDLRPDLIVTQAQCDVCAVRYQEVIDFVASEPVLAATKVVDLQPHRLLDVVEDIARVGQAANRAAEGEAYKEKWLRRYNDIRETANSGGSQLKRTSVAVLEWTEPLMGAGNWTPELVEAAGGRPLFGEAGKHSTYIAWGDVVASRPEILIVAPCGFNLQRSHHEAQRLIELAGYHDLPAVAAERAFVIDGNAYLNRSGPRLLDTLEILAHLIHPDRFPPPTGELAEARAWTKLA